jgi:hypothetical protein
MAKNRAKGAIAGSASMAIGGSGLLLLSRELRDFVKKESTTIRGLQGNDALVILGGAVVGAICGAEDGVFVGNQFKKPSTWRMRALKGCCIGALGRVIAETLNGVITGFVEKRIIIGSIIVTAIGGAIYGAIDGPYLFEEDDEPVDNSTIKSCNP